MELLLSVLFGVWICFTALIYRSLTSGRGKGGKK